MLSIALCCLYGALFAFGAPTPAGAETTGCGKRATFASTTTWSFTGKTLPTGLRKSTDLIGHDQPGLLDHKFDKKNVQVKDGFMQLVVPGGQTGDVISSAEVGTDFELLYGSVTTYAILTDTPGACNGMIVPLF